MWMARHMLKHRQMRTCVQNDERSWRRRDEASLDSGPRADDAWGEAPRVGDELGAYTILELLGEGGMARVYLAEHRGICRRVALKVLSNDRAVSENALKSFRQEAAAVNQIRHANIVEITDCVESHPRYRFHVMELLEGETLRAIIDRGERVSIRRALDIAIQVADGLAAAHASGFVHRDIKPENVFITRRAAGGDHVKLIDFGAAKLVTEGAGLAAGEPIVGTPLYMAPEQMWGQGSGFQTDAYAFALTIYELIAGRVPFTARKFCELREERCSSKPAPLRFDSASRADIPSALEQLIMELLERDPEKRLRSMAVVAQRLRRILASLDERTASRPWTTHWTFKSARLYAVAAAGLMGLASALVWELSAPSRTPPAVTLAANSHAASYGTSVE
jgi:eukaryotic-like serine/threonine-protein kinase